VCRTADLHLLHGTAISCEIMYRSDQVHCVASSPITMPWDPCAHSGQTKRDVPLHSVLAVWASHQLIVWRLEDPDNSSSCRPAWGQAGFQGEGNVMDRTMRLGRGAGWAGLWAEGSGTCSYKRQTPGRREGRTEQIPELFPDPPRLLPNPPVSLDPAMRVLPSTPKP
jgi:hypothetical protein